jgi:hypothetical protein
MNATEHLQLLLQVNLDFFYCYSIILLATTQLTHEPYLTADCTPPQLPRILGLFMPWWRALAIPLLPTVLPSSMPTSTPTSVPLVRPTSAFTAWTTAWPTAWPTALPTAWPTVLTTWLPTVLPASVPSSLPHRFRLALQRPTAVLPTLPPTALPQVLATLDSAPYSVADSGADSTSRSAPIIVTNCCPDVRAHTTRDRHSDASANKHANSDANKNTVESTIVCSDFRANYCADRRPSQQAPGILGLHLPWTTSTKRRESSCQSRQRAHS